MEHRCDRRVLFGLDVVVHDRGNSPIDGRTRDISRNGMCVEPGALQGLRTGAAVRVAFRTGFGLHILPALVVWAENERAGLMFARMDERSRTALFRLLDNSPQYSSAGDRHKTARALRWSLQHD